MAAHVEQHIESADPFEEGELVCGIFRRHDILRDSADDGGFRFGEPGPGDWSISKAGDAPFDVALQRSLDRLGCDRAADREQEWIMRWRQPGRDIIRRAEEHGV